MVEEATQTQPQVENVQAPAPAAPAPAEPAPAEGKAGPKKPWMAQLKGHLQGNEVLSQFDEFSSVAEKFLEFDGKRDRLIEIPAPDATEDLKAQFRAKLGVPAKAEEYKIAEPKLPEGLKWSKPAEGEFRKLALEAGLNNEQANKLLAFDTQRTLNAVAQRQAAIKAQQEAQVKQDQQFLAKLHGDWGDKFEVNKQAAKDAMAKTTTEELRKLLADRGVLDHPLVAQHFFSLGTKIGDTEFIPGGSASIPKRTPGIVNLDAIRDTLPQGRPPKRPK